MNIKKDTIINLLCVFIPLFVLLIIIAPKYLRKGEEAKHRTAVLQIKIIEEAIEQYFKDNGKYPTTEEGLHVLTVNREKK